MINSSKEKPSTLLFILEPIPLQQRNYTYPHTEYRMRYVNKTLKPMFLKDFLTTYPFIASIMFHIGKKIPKARINTIPATITSKIGSIRAVKVFKS